MTNILMSLASASARNARACRLGLVPHVARFCSLAEPIQRLEPVTNALRSALESCSFIDISADQAYLETDPSDRTCKDEYVMRYQRFARDELEQAISKYDQLCSTLGEIEVKQLKRENVQFALIAADSLLARDKLNAALKAGQERLREKQRSGLNREDLVFCDA